MPTFSFTKQWAEVLSKLSKQQTTTKKQLVQVAFFIVIENYSNLSIYSLGVIPV